MDKAFIRTTVSVDLHLEGQELQRVLRWISLRRTGKEEIPLDETCSNEHQDAHCRAHRTQRVTLVVYVDEDGRISLTPPTCEKDDVRRRRARPRTR